MDDLEKVETIRTKCNVSYTDAKAALDAADGNVLDAIIWLESQGKTQTTSAHAATESAPVDEPSAEMVAAQAAYEKSSEKTDFSKKMDSVWEYLKKLFRLSLDTKFIATRRDAIILNIPILIPIVALFAWGATIWLMLLGLFFGMRYRIDSDGDVPGSINNLMNHAADAADDIKQNLNDDKQSQTGARMARILIVEDEEKIARFVTLELEHEGYQVEHAADGRTAVDLALERDYDLILLDVLLPQLNGMEVLRRVRKHKDVPVIMVTARDAVMDKVAGLDAGADDYLTKPFAIEELFARIRVALKRSEAVRTASGVGGVGAGEGATGAAAMPLAGGSAQASASPSPAALVVGSVALDPDRREVTVDGSPIVLTAREFDVLALLMAHAGTVLTRERIAHEALGYEYVGDTNNVDVHIAHLRAKIEDAGGARIIQTVRGVGYVCRA